MHEIIQNLFGSGKNLNTLQMSSRIIIVFLLCLIMVRISGRRSFGIRTPLDNIIVILLGSILGRGVAGASGFIPVIISCFIIVLLHRAFAWMIVHSEKFGNLIEGKKIILFEKGDFISENLNTALVNRDDIIQGVRKSALTEDLNGIDKIYIEKNGEISALKKKNFNHN